MEKQMRLDLGEEKQINIFGESESVLDIFTDTKGKKAKKKDKIDYDNLVFQMKKDNIYDKKMEKWLEDYMRYYN